MELIADIPRLYTGLAEWAGCLIMLLICRRRVRGAVFIAISAAAPVGPTADIPDQVVAAAWAMAKAAGSTEDDWDTFLVNWLKLPSNAQEDLDLYEAVCVDLAERAFFRDLGRPRDAEEPDQSEEG